MRSDWDDAFKSEKQTPTDQQKRYPRFTEDEWRLLLHWSRSHLDTLTDKLPRGSDAEIHHALMLVRKIEARLKEKE